MSTHGSQRARTVEAALRFVVDTGVKPIVYPSEGDVGDALLPSFSRIRHDYLPLVGQTPAYGSRITIIAA